MSKGKILFQLSGSIACFKACALISRLAQAGYELEVVATRAALEFVGEATLEGLTGRRVHTDTFARGEYMKHIHLIRWADLVLLCPATANTLGKMASGVGDDLVSTLFLAHDFKKPYLVAPAMNATMMQHPATQSSLERLSEWGVEILGSGEGALACGEVGEGRLLEPDELFSLIEQRFTRASGPRVLVTSGGTREPIDGVRSITNTSSGRTGAAIATELARAGFDVTLLRAQGSAAAAGVRTVEYISFADLRARLREELGGGSYAGVVHAAAVSDYSVASVTADGRDVSGSAKLDSAESLTLHLRRNPKLVDELREMAGQPFTVIAFKLTNTLDERARDEAVLKLGERSRPDLIVHNDLHEISGAAHPARLFSARGELREMVASKAGLARAIARYLTLGEKR